MRLKMIKGYPVINLSDGVLWGRIQDLIINPQEKKVEGLVVGEKGFLKGRSRRIPFEQIYNIGKDVLIIKSEEQAPAAETRAPLEEFKDYSFLGSNVVSSKGDYIAKVQDFTFSVQTGALEELLLFDTPERERKDKVIYLSIDGVLNLGKDYVITVPDYASYIREERETEQVERREPKEEAEQLEQPSKEEEPPAERSAEEEHSTGERLQDKLPSLHNVFQNVKEIWDHLEKEISSEGRELARESKERIRKYILNKRVNYAIKNNEGQPLVEPDAKITEEVLQQAEAQNKVFNLFLAVISQELEEGLDIFKDKIKTTFR